MSENGGKSGKSIGCLLLSGAGCLLLAIIGIAVVAFGYFGWDSMAARFPVLKNFAVMPGGAGSPALAVNLNDYVDTWVVESEAVRPQADDLVVFHVENGALVGLCPDPRHKYRVDLSPDTTGRMTGTASGEGMTAAITAELSADKSRLTVVMFSGTESDTAVLVRFVPWTVATAPVPAATAPVPARPAVTPARRNPTPAPAQPAPRPAPQKPDTPRLPSGKPPGTPIEGIIADIERDAVRLPN